MKFYIISIILNIIALFIPVVYYTSGGGGKGKEQDETVTVNLNENVFDDTSQGAGQKSDGAGISAKGNDNTGIQQTSPVSQPQEKINTVSSQNIQQNNQKKNASEVLQNKTEQLQTSKSDNKIPVSQGGASSAVQPSGNNGKTVQSSGNTSGNAKSSALASGSTAGAGHSGEGSGHHTNAGSGNGHGSSGTGKTSGGSGGGSGGGRGTGTGSGEGKNTDVCNEGKDFTVSYNPNLKYPVAAQRLGNKGVVVVMVKLRFNSSGSVSVISASGGSGVFQQDAKSAASRIKVNIKNPDTLKCTISKPFKFELK